jgi:tetratricopeptide (TPR) repeat protein
MFKIPLAPLRERIPAFKPMPLTAPLDQTKPPPFWEMGEYRFQDFCQAVWRTENTDCHLYGVRGQKQHGIDLRTYGQPPGAGSVGQCKCYEEFTSPNLRDAVQEFTDHSAYWRRQKIKVYRLYVASSCANTSVQKEYTKQRKLLSRKGITFKLYDSHGLVTALRHEPTIVSRFCGDHFVEPICGANALGFARQAVMAAVIGLSENGAIFVEWESDRNKELEALRERIRRGQSEVVYQECLQLLRAAEWRRYTPRLRSKVFRILATIDCNKGDCDKGNEWLKQAKEEDPSADYQVIDALYEANTRGVTAGLTKLGEPTSIDAWHIQLSLWLVDGKPDSMIRAFNCPPFPLNAESYRLKAIALLLTNRIEEAVEAADVSLQMVPLWTMNRFTAAMVNYQSVISPLFHAWGHPNWPVPPDWQFVRQDQIALKRLEKAAEIFRALLAEGLPSPEGTLNMETWLLAAYACHPQKRKEAVDLIDKRLKEKPDHFRFTMWAAARGFSFDENRTREALKVMVSAGDAPLPAIIELINLTGLHGAVPETKRLLNENRERFIALGAQDEWKNLMVQVLAQEQSWDQANALLAEDTSEVRWSLKAAVAHIRHKQNGSIKELADELGSIYEQSKSPEELLPAAQAKLHANEPDWILAYRDDALLHFPHLRTLQLLMVSAFKANQFDLALNLLEQNKSLIPAEGLPDEIIRLKGRCLRLLGRLTNAFEALKGLGLGAGHLDNTLELLDLQIAMIDGPGAVSTAHVLLTIADAKSSELLHACRSVLPFSVPVASRIWRKVIEFPNLSDAEILAVVDLGYRLGLDQLVGPFTQQLQRIHASGSGLVQMISIDELIQLQQEHAQNIGQANQDYNRGLSPVHVTSGALQCSLGFLYHVLPKRNAATNTPLRSAPLLIRSGAHTREDLPVLQGKNVVVDITSLLLARHLDIFSLVEEHLGNLSISAWVPTSLHRQIQQIVSQQPALDKPRELVYQAWLQGRIKPMPALLPGTTENNERLRQMGAEWCAQFSELQKEGGLLVTFFPVLAQLGSRQIIALSADELKTLVPIGTFLLGLQGAGVLSASDLAKCNEVFGIEAQFVGEACKVSRQQAILLDGVIAERFASAGVLDKIAAFCQLRFTQFTVQLLEIQQEAFDSREELANWLRELSEHVSEQVLNGTFKTFSEPQTEAEVVRFTQQPDFGCLHDLLPNQAQPERLSWCDDRLITSHRSTDAGPVFGILEMLGILRRDGKLSKEQYFSKLHELRRSNVRYLPITPEEIVFSLKGATVNSYGISETAEMSALRMSLAAALADPSRLQLPGNEARPNAPMGDLPWIIDANRASFEALQLIWKEDAPEVAVAKSEWIINSLIFDLSALRDMHRPESGDYDVRQFYFLNFQEWMLVAFRQPTKFLSNRDADSGRRLFFRWMYERLLVPMLAANPDAETSLGDAVGLALEQVIRVGKQVRLTERQAAISALGLLLDLPVPLQDIAAVPELLRTEFAIEKGQTVVRMGGIEFAYVDFWKGMAEAVNGRSYQLTALEGPQCQFVPSVVTPFGHEVQLDRPNLPTLVSTNENNPILHDDLNIRLQFLEKLTFFADYPAASRLTLLNEIAAISESLPRLERLTRELAKCPTYYYKGLADNLQSDSDFPPDSLFPIDPELLPRFLHVRDQGLIEWNSVAEELLTALPLKEAVLRLSCLPRIMPNVIFDRAVGLSEADFEQLLNSLEQESHSSIRRLHAFHLVARRAESNDKWQTKAIELLSGLTKIDNDLGFEAFTRVLNCCFRRLEQYAAVQEWSPTAVVSAAWSHAVQLYEFLVKGGLSQETIGTRFENEVRKCSARLIPQREDAYADASSPRNLSWGTFLCRAVGDILSELPDEVRDNLRPSTMQMQAAISDQTQEAVAFAELAAETETRSNHLEGFLGGPWLPPFQALFPNMSGWLVNDPHAYALSRLTEIEADPYNIVAWTELWFLFRGAPIYESVSDRITHLIETLDFARLFEVKGEEAQYVLAFCCAQAGQMEKAEPAARMLEELAKIAVYCQQQRDRRQSLGADDVAYERILWSLIQDVQFLSIKKGSKENPSPFCSSMNRLIQLCPSLGSSLRRRLGGEPPALQFKLNRGIWPFYMRLRGVP